MNIEKVLKIVQPFEAKLILGEKGISRPVKAVEVLEVPQVEDWVVEDLLLISTFYTVQDNEEAQADLIKVLIDKNAAGIIVKLGRFVDRLPESVRQLAEDMDFPIISLPKDVPYIDILTPLYHQLNISLDDLLLQEIKGTSYETVDQILDEFFKAYEIKTYIENLQGELMYSGHYPLRDPWRQSILLFSKPSYTDAESLLNEWKKMFSEDSTMEYSEIKSLKRIVVPLYAKGKLYGIFHVIYRSSEQQDLLTDQFIAKLVNKVHVTLMSELISLQKKYFDEKEELLNLEQNDSDANSKVLFHVRVPSTTFEMEENELVDYTLLILKQLKRIMDPIQDVTKSFMFVRNSKFYMLLIFTPTRISSTGDLRKSIEKQLIESVISNYLISISSPFIRMSELEDKLISTTRTIDIGLHMHPDMQVYSYNKLGIYQLLLKISSDQQAIDYVDGILNPLEEIDEVLIETLRMYLSENGNALRTAEQLYVNRRTVTNRLKRIRQICDIDLDDAETAFILQFCLKIREL